MLETTVQDVVDATGAALLCGRMDAAVRGVSIDSREVAAGGLFVCFVGERVDGNDYALGALEAGAAAIALTREPAEELVERAKVAGCALFRVKDDDPEQFMLRLAGAWRAKNAAWTVVGVTGSVGKTTTKDMLAAALAERYRVHATKGNLNNLIGLPLTLLTASPTDEVLVCEMGMNHPGELARLSACARPTVALITNVGTSHVGMLGSRENIARAKAEILSAMRPTSEDQGGVHSFLAMTSDNDFARLIEDEFARPAGIEVIYVGGSTSAQLHAEDIHLDGEGFAHLTLSFTDGLRLDAKLGVPGLHVVPDVLLVIAVAERLGVDRRAAAVAVERMPQTHMRLEVVKRQGRPRVIDDSYNASPDSMASALDVLSSMSCVGRRVAILGEMGELGDEARRLHGYVGAYAAAKRPDLLVVVGNEWASEMAEAALTMGLSEDRIERALDVDEASRVIVPALTEDDLVLVKASRAVGLDALVREVLG